MSVDAVFHVYRVVGMVSSFEPKSDSVLNEKDLVLSENLFVKVSRHTVRPVSSIPAAVL